MLMGKDLLGSGTREELESALSVSNVPDTDDAQDGVQAVHEDVTQYGPLRVSRERQKVNTQPPSAP